MAALAITRAIRDLIERHVVARTYTVQTTKQGDQGIWLQTAREYLAGETIVLRDNNQAEMHTVRCVTESSGVPVLVLCEDVTAPFVAGESWVEKTFNRQVVEDILIGNPDHLDNYPAITIEAKNMNREPITLSSVSDTYMFEIGVWNDATTYADAYETLLIITDKTRNALFRDFYPLVSPFFSTILTEDAQPTDTVIKVHNDDFLRVGQWIWIADRLGVKRHNRVKAGSETNVIELSFPVGFAFKAGSDVIRPRVHLYDPRIESISYDDAQDQDHLLKSSTITYSIKLEMRRHK